MTWKRYSKMMIGIGMPIAHKRTPRIVPVLHSAFG